MRPWLFFSLALNLLLAGIMLGTYVRPLLGPPAPMHADFDAMPAHGRALAHKAFDDIHAIHEQSRKEFELARAALAKAIAAEPFDAAALDKASENFGQVNIQKVTKTSARMDALIKVLTPQERLFMADHLRHMPPPAEHGSSIPPGPAPGK